MGSSYSLPGIAFFQATGITKFCRSGFERRSKSFDPKDLAVDLRGRVILITGANSGLGYEAALELARRNATLLIVCRDRTKGEEAVAKIVAETGNQDVRLHVLDVSRPPQVKAFAEEFLASGSKLHVLINNAGVLPSERRDTPEGVDVSFATNTLGSFAMVESLLPALIASAPSRVINVSSGGMYTVKMNTHDFQSREGKFDGMMSYSQCKRQIIYLTEYWAQKHAGSGVTFNSMHPGWARTPGTQSSLPPWFDRLDLRSASQGADTIVWLAAAERLAQETGKFWFDREVASTHMPLAHTHSSPEEVKQLYDYCSQLYSQF